METSILSQAGTNEILWEYQRRIVDIYNQYGLTSLSGLDNEYTLKGRELLLWYFDITGKNKNKGSFDYFKNIDDLSLSSDELLFFTGNLFLYRPYLNNPIKEGFHFSGSMLYPNYQNMEASRYDMYAEIAAQQVYNFWSRIAELIKSFFPNALDKKKVYFPTIIDAIPKSVHNSPHYTWLKNFRTNEYKELLDMRNEIVHYTSVGTGFRHSHTESVRDKEEIQKLLDKRDSWADFYKKHISLSIDGMEQTLLFLEHVNMQASAASQQKITV